MRSVPRSSFVLMLGGIVLAGCGSNSPNFPLAAGGAESAYVVQQSFSTVPQQVLVLPLGQSGAVSPSVTLSVPADMAIQATATDNGGDLYVAGSNGTGYAVLVYDRPAMSSMIPVRVISLASDFGAVYSLAIDGTGNLYVAMETAILVYSQASSGKYSLRQTISGPATNIFIPGLMAVNPAGDIYIAFAGGIEVFASGSTGNVMPNRIITAPANSGYGGIAVDSAGDVYASYSTLKNSSIVEFAPTATGAAVPLKEVSFPALGSGPIYGLQRDKVGNTYAILMESILVELTYRISWVSAQTPLEQYPLHRSFIPMPGMIRM